MVQRTFGGTDRRRSMRTVPPAQSDGIIQAIRTAEMLDSVGE